MYAYTYISEAKENRARFEADSHEMDREFNSLTASVLQSLQSRGISKKTVAASLMGLSCLKTVYESENGCLFRKQRTKLLNASSLADIWMIISDYMSFFDYYLISLIVELHGSVKDKEDMKTYEKNFKKYVQRRVFPVNTSSCSSRDDSEYFVVRLDSAYDGCEMAQLEEFRTRLSEILNLTPGVLKLSKIIIGSIFMIFEIPDFIHIFPLNTEQEKALVHQKVIQLSHPAYEFPKVTN